MYMYGLIICFIKLNLWSNHVFVLHMYSYACFFNGNCDLTTCTMHSLIIIIAWKQQRREYIWSDHMFLHTISYEFVLSMPFQWQLWRHNAFLTARKKHETRICIRLNHVNGTICNGEWTPYSCFSIYFRVFNG